MGYQIEVSYDIRKNQQSQKIIKKAEQCGCWRYYKNYEFEGNNRQMYRHHVVFVLMFNENEEEIVKFIKYIKREKGLFLETVAYDDTVKYYLMYASSKYLNIIEKECKDNYLKNKKDRNLYNQTSYIMRVLQPRV
jgi:hypothetical protein